MVSPLGQRQMFQTINVESVKTAGELSGLLQREASQRQAIADRMAEDQASVPEIPNTSAMRAEERKGGRQGESGRHGQGREEDPEADPEKADAKANPAETHLDFLA
jgi:hypothetical protein